MQTNEQLLQLINRQIEQWDLKKQPIELYEPITYILALGGKRVRPLLALLGCRLFSDDVMPAMPAAMAVEVFHNFTLLHDDMMDNADTRRGKPTVHKKWNENTAILSGDAMQVQAFQLLAGADTAKLKPLLDIFVQTAIEVCEGQQYDMNFELRRDVSANEYIEMIRLKTAVLLGAALKMGAISGGASAGNADALYTFGEQIGIAFQLQDDLLDVYGDPAVFGKKIGGDILSNKKTYMLIRAFEEAQAAEGGELLKWILTEKFNPEEKIQAVTQIYNRLGIKEICEEKIREYTQMALVELDRVQVEESRKTELRVLVHSLMKRNF
ncbi:MAG: polyprenyl synthetase family protein [Prevotellaceae bacterium]|jgi:geranylgeranyl diphosphate synthase type II|nr:polyprenyl synthetase family protein [Prevotellaceae bacterium]